MKLSFWLESFFSHSGRHIRRNWRSCRHRPTLRRDFEPHGNQPLPAWVEILETRIWLASASDFGVAPLPYPTTLAEGGAEHVIGVELGGYHFTDDAETFNALASGLK